MNSNKEQSPKFRTVWGVYYLNDYRNEGHSEFWDNEAEARSRRPLLGWTIRVEKQTYELEEDSYHDCGDDE